MSEKAWANKEQMREKLIVFKAEMLRLIFRQKPAEISSPDCRPPRQIASMNSRSHHNSFNSTFTKPNPPPQHPR